MQPLFSHIQWLSLKNASEESLNELEQLITKREIFVSYRAIHIFLKLFSFLKKLLSKFISCTSGNRIFLYIIFSNDVKFYYDFTTKLNYVN